MHQAYQGSLYTLTETAQEWSHFQFVNIVIVSSSVMLLPWLFCNR